MRSRRSRRGQRGFTLIEVSIGALIAIFLTAAAVVFATHETRLLGYSTEQIEMQSSARGALDMLAHDLEMAGAGLGYQNVGGVLTFAGLQTGPFFALGTGGAPGQAFGQRLIGLAGAMNDAQSAQYFFPTHDLGILYADDARLTISRQSGLGGDLCDATGILDSNEDYYAVLRTPDFLAAYSAIIRPLAGPAAGNCTPGFGVCGPNFLTGGSGCRPFTIIPDPFNGTGLFNSQPGASAINYSSGEIAVGLKQVIWWVANDTIPQDANRANLRRVELDHDSFCDAGTLQTCGGEYAYNVETLQYQVWRFVPEIGVGAGDPFTDDPRWIAVDPGPIGPPNPAVDPTVRTRLRVDVELVVRARMPDRIRREALRVPLAMNGQGRCIPGGALMPAAGSCGPGDHVERRVHRISVEVKNAGANRL